MDEDIQYWLRLAESDMSAAEVLHQAAHELQCLFFLQQAVEKTLKALLIRKTSALAPRIQPSPIG